MCDQHGGSCTLGHITEEAKQEYLDKVKDTVATMPGRIVYFRSWDGYCNAYYDPGFCDRPENQDHPTVISRKQRIN